MDIRYKIAKQVISFTQKEEDDLFSYVLTNQKGDSIVQSLEPEVCKSFGFFTRDNEKQNMIKVFDWFGTLDYKTKNVEIGEYSIVKEFTSPYYEHSNTSEIIGFEKITISPNGGFLFETNIDSSIVIDLDVKYFDDYSKFGKNYSIYEEDGVLFIEFQKTNENEDLTLGHIIGIKTPNLQYSKIEKWIEKTYLYDALRGLDNSEFIFRALSIDIGNVHKKINVGYGFTKKEVLDQLLIMDNFDHIIEEVERGIDEEGFGKTQSIIPLSMQSQLSYDVAKRKLFDFVVKNPHTNSSQIIAGFPWFYQEWSRDEVFSIRAFMEIGELAFTKEILLKLCNSIDENGEVPRMFIDGSLKSFDASLLLAKRIEDYIFYLDEHNMFHEIYEDGTLQFFYDSLLKIFESVMKTKWNGELELLNIKPEEWWRDTINWIEYPLALQIAMLNLISTLAILSRLLGNNSKSEEFLDFESDYRAHIKEKYLRNSMLYDEIHNDTISCDIYLAYYLYPDILTKEEWEVVFEKALKHLYLSWGGVSSLSKHDSRYVKEYSGANDKSYHQGDSWYFINAIAAMTMNHCNSNKFKQEITQISKALTNQVLFKGAFGHIAEVSSASTAQTRGTPAQCWSLALYIEMMHSIYLVKTKYD